MHAIAERLKLPDEPARSLLGNLGVRTGPAFLVIGALVQDLPNQTAEPMGDDAGNRLLSLTYPIGGETRQYNTLGQLTQIYWNASAYVNYNYPTNGTNNGKISSTTSSSGETVTYAYDSLNRMMSAAGNGWAETYGFDAFGSLLSKTPTAGTPPSLSQAVNPANNQIVGQSYDANGNQLTSPGYSGYATYDGENRIAAAPGVQYAYNSRNQRVWSGTVDSNNNLTGQHVYFYGITGKRLGTYSLNVSYGSGQPTEIADPPASLAMYFGGKRLDIVEDRLGSSFGIPLYPWGEDRTGQSNDQTKFATYTRDSATLLDYADNRYYSNAYGRFMTPDPYQASGRPSDPQSWNQYAYTRGDPVNRVDMTGMDDTPPPTFRITVYGTGGDGGSGFGGGSSLFGGDPVFAKAYFQPTSPEKGPGIGTSVTDDRNIINNVTYKASDVVANPDCAKLFLASDSNTPANRAALANMLASLADNGTIRPSLTPPPNQPDTQGWTTNDIFHSGLIYFYMGGSFFTGNFKNNSAFSGLSMTQGQELMIIHEFLHYMGIVGPDDKNQTYTLPDGEVVKGSQGISNAVRKDCL